MQPLLRDTFFVLSGDGVTDFDLTRALAAHRQRGAEATMLLHRIPDPQALAEFGVVETSSTGRILRFQEKPAPGEAFSDTVNTGIYLLEPSLLSRIPATGPFDFSRDLFPELLRDNAAFYGHSGDGYWCDIGNLRQYRQVHQDALAGKIGLDLGAFGAKEVQRGVWVGQGVQMHPSARFLGTCYVGRNSEIHEAAVMANGAVVGSGSRIGRGARIAASVVGSNARVGTNVELQDCILGDGCSLSDGNRHHDSVVMPNLAAMQICLRTGHAVAAVKRPQPIAA